MSVAPIGSRFPVPLELRPTDPGTEPLHPGAQGTGFTSRPGLGTPAEAVAQGRPPRSILDLITKPTVMDALEGVPGWVARPDQLSQLNDREREVLRKPAPPPPARPAPGNQVCTLTGQSVVNGKEYDPVWGGLRKSPCSR